MNLFQLLVAMALGQGLGALDSFQRLLGVRIELHRAILLLVFSTLAKRVLIHLCSSYSIFPKSQGLYENVTKRPCLYILHNYFTAISTRLIYF